MAVFEILCACLVILLLLYYYLTYDFNYWTSRGVNGPKPVLFFGNIADFITGRTCLGDIFKRIYDEYPQERIVGAFMRGEPVLILRDTEYIKQVLIKDFTAFPERHTLVCEKAEPMSLHLFRLDAPRWRPLRTQLSPVFTSGKLKDMFHLLLNCSEHFERYLAEMVPADKIVECRDLTAKFTVDVIGSCAFGIEMNALNEETNEFCVMGRKIFRSDLKVLIRSMVRETSFFKYFGHFFDDHDVTNFMTNITRDTIEYRKKNNVSRNDFVDMLIYLKDHPEKLGTNDVTDTFIASQAFVFFAAGFETSSTTMAHAMYELAQNHKIQERLRDEIKQVLSDSNGAILYDDIKKMTYLEQVFRETLRKYPPLMYLSRKTERDYTFEEAQFTIRKGLKIFIPIYAIQNDPRVYPNPEVFDPERFHANNNATDMKNSMYYLPFGTGPRNCIGARFAIYQVKIGLIKVLMNYKIDICEKTQIPIVHHPMSHIMLQPKNGIHVRLTKVA